MKAVISGASQGLGKAIATELAKAGYELILLSRSRSKLEKVQEELDPFTKVSIYPIDLSVSSEISQLELMVGIEKCLLINNLGTFAMEEVTQLRQQEVQKMMEINLYASLELTNHLLPQLKKSSRAHIFNICSVNGLESNPEATAYSISKHAMKAWNDSLREKLRKEGIKLTAFYPGAINTTSWDGIEVDRSAMIQPEDIGKLIVQVALLSEGTLVEELKLTPLNFEP